MVCRVWPVPGVDHVHPEPNQWGQGGRLRGQPQGFFQLTAKGLRILEGRGAQSQRSRDPRDQAAWSNGPTREHAEPKATP